MALWDFITQPPTRQDVESATAGSLLGPLSEPEMAKATGTADRSAVKALIKQYEDRGGKVALGPKGQLQFFRVKPLSAEKNFLRDNKAIAVQVLSPPPPPKTSLYARKIAQPATKALAEQIKGIEPEGLQRWVSPERLARIAVPQDLTQVGTLAGIAMGEGGPTFGARLAARALGGAAGAAQEGQSVAGGALQGAAARGIGEGAGVVAGGIGRMFGRKALLNKTTANVGKAISDALPALGNAPTTTAAELERMFTHEDALEPLVNEMNAVSQKAAGLAPGNQFEVPVFLRGTGRQSWAKAKLSDAEKTITELNEEGWRLDQSGEAKYTKLGKIYRKLSYEARERLAEKLNKVEAGLGDAWQQARKDFAAGKALQRIFTEKGVFNPETGMVDQARLSDLISRDYWTDLVRTMGRTNTERLLSAIRRGAKGPGADVAGQSMRGGMRLGGMPFIRPPIPPQFVGDVPPYMTPAPYRLPGAIAGARAIGSGDQ